MMKRLAIAAVGLALVVGVTITGCRSSGYSQAEVEGTVAALLTASANNLPPTLTPSPLLTENIVLNAVFDVAEGECSQKPNERAYNICMTQRGFYPYPFNASPNCDIVYYPEHDTWEVTCHGNTFEGVNFEAEGSWYLVDDHTGRVSELDQSRGLAP
jgi:hypothetical protein